MQTGLRYRFNNDFASRGKFRVFSANRSRYQQSSQVSCCIEGFANASRGRAEVIEIVGDSLLVIKQLADEYECKDDILRGYYEQCQLLLGQFKDATFKHVPREQNQEANNLAPRASGYWLVENEVADIEVEGINEE